jgi:ribonuclease HI
MKKLLSEHSKIVTYIDGACNSNPGKAGAGVAFFAPTFKSRSALSHISDSDHEE